LYFSYTFIVFSLHLRLDVSWTEEPADIYDLLDYPYLREESAILEDVLARLGDGSPCASPSPADACSPLSTRGSIAAEKEALLLPGQRTLKSKNLDGGGDDRPPLSLHLDSDSCLYSPGPLQSEDDIVSNIPLAVSPQFHTNKDGYLSKDKNKDRSGEKRSLSSSKLLSQRLRVEAMDVEYIPGEMDRIRAVLTHGFLASAPFTPLPWSQMFRAQ
jgi:hypothetical protein